MGYTDDYEYEDDEDSYQDDDEEYLSYDDDDDPLSKLQGSSGSSRIGGGGLPGAGSRFSSEGDSSSSRLGGGSRFGGSTPIGGSGRIGGGSAFGSRASNDDDDDEDEKPAPSRFGGSPASPTGNSSFRPGGGTTFGSPRASSDDKDDKSTGGTPSRFGGPSGTSGTSAFRPGGSGTGAGGFGGNRPSPFSKPADDDDDDEDDDDKSTGFKGTSSPRFGSPSSPVGGSSSSVSRPSGGGTTFNAPNSPRSPGGTSFGSGSSSSSTRPGTGPLGRGNDDKDDKPAGSRFGGSPSSPTSGSSAFGGNRPGTGPLGRGNDDKDDKPAGNRFGGSSSSSTTTSTPNRFGGSSPSPTDKKDEKPASGGGLAGRFGVGGGDKKDEKPASGGSGGRFGGSSPSPTDKKDDKPASGGGLGGLGGRFGVGGGDKKDDKSASKPDDKKDEKSGGGFGGLGGRFGVGGGDKKDDKSAKPNDKKDEKSGGGLGAVTGALGGLAGRFGSGGGDKKDDKSAKPTDKKDEKSGGGLGGTFGGLGGRFGGGGDKKDDKAPAAKADDKSSFGKPSGGSPAGSFGSKPGGPSAQSASDNKPAPFGGNKPAPFGGGDKSAPAGAAKPATSASSAPAAGGPRFGSFGNKDDKKDDKKPADNKKAAAATADAEASGGVFGRLGSSVAGIFGRNKPEEKPTKQRAAARPKVPTTTTEDGLTLDNWLDIIGVGLVFGSLVLTFSALSREQAAIGAVHKFIGQLFGWGALAVPLTMFLVGMWLIVRHFGEDAPKIDPIRVAGVVILFISLLIIFQYLDSFSYDNIVLEDGATTQALLRARLDYSWRDLQSGGGIIGAQLYYFFVVNITELGGFLVIIFTTIIGGMLLTRLSAAEMMRGGAGMWLAFREWMQHQAEKRRIERQIAQQKAAELQAQKLRAQPAMGDTGAMAAVPVAAAYAAPPVQQPVASAAGGREIRFSLGGQVSTLDNQGNPIATPQQPMPMQPQAPVMQPPVAQPPVMQPPAMQPQQPAASAGGNLISRMGAVAGVGGLFGKSSNGEQAPVAPQQPQPQQPAAYSAPVEQAPVQPMQPVYTPPVVPQQPAAYSAPVEQAPVQPAQPVYTPPVAQPQQPMNIPNAIPFPQTPAQPGYTEPASAPAEDEDPMKARQDRLNALRRGETGPLSVGAMSTARREDVESAFVPQSEAEREKPAYSSFGRPEDRITHPTEKLPFAPQPSNITPPSQLPSAQSSQTMFQRSLSAQPISSEIQSSKKAVEWRLPDYRTLLSSGSEQEFDRQLLLKQAKIIEDTLADFGAPGRVVEVNTGPVITQFGVEPDYLPGRGGKKQRVKVGAIAALDKDLQLALGARSIRVEAPVPGKGYVGIEVPNAQSTLVSLRDVMDSPSFLKHKSPLAIALGQSVSGAPISADLASMPHLLVAGTTGSGKSVCVNSIIASILSRNTPDVVKFIMVDPKRVELTGYNGIPHLVAPVVVELERIVGVLKWVTREMDDRYKKFSDAGARNIEDYNKNRDTTTTERMPYIIVLIDELADLMMLAPEETERTITRIAALARATGIHLVIATQRPSVDVVTGLIKANFPARIAFAVAGSVDSRVILDQPGAERLLGKGDMLYLSGDSPAALRLQGVFVSDMEINNIVRYWKMQALTQPDSPQAALAPRFTPSEAPKDVLPAKERGRQQAFWDSGEQLPSFATGKPRPTPSTMVTQYADEDDDDDFFDDDDKDENSKLTADELSGDSDSDDELYEKSVELVRRLDKASISLLQRRLRIGYTRAARLIDMMEARGVVGPSKDGSSKPRDVLPMR